MMHRQYGERRQYVILQYIIYKKNNTIRNSIQNTRDFDTRRRQFGTVVCFDDPS